MIHLGHTKSARFGTYTLQPRAVFWLTAIFLEEAAGLFVVNARTRIVSVIPRAKVNFYKTRNSRA